MKSFIVLWVSVAALGNELLIEAVKETKWCHEGASVERMALSRPWEQNSKDRILILSDPPVGSIRFEVMSRGVSGTAFIKCFDQVAVASTDLSSGEAFSPKSVQFKPMEISHYVRSGVFRSLTELQTLEVRGFVRQGTVLSRLQTQRQSLVVAGQNISLVRESGGLKISTTVRALQSGKESDWIRVENISSRKVLMARVSGPQTVTR